jgi:hypothetical protein
MSVASSRIRKAAAAGAAAVAIGGISFGASAFAAGSGPAAHPAGAPASAAVRPAAPVVRPAAQPAAPVARHTAPKVVRQLIRQGRVDGLDWSVTLEYYPTLPKGYVYQPFPGFKQPKPTSLLCQRMVIGGVRIDHQGGPWADCQGLRGAHDPQGSGGEGLASFHDKGLSGSRLFVATPEANVASGVVALSDGTRLTARTVAVPHTGYRAWAVAIPNGRTIATIDQYDARHHRVSHETDWR